MSEDWRKDTPFPRHWLFYVLVKIGILAFAIYLASRFGYI
jgi:hypothetical protein